MDKILSVFLETKSDHPPTDKKEKLNTTNPTHPSNVGLPPNTFVWLSHTYTKKKTELKKRIDTANPLIYFTLKFNKPLSAYHPSDKNSSLTIERRQTSDRRSASKC